MDGGNIFCSAGNVALAIMVANCWTDWVRFCCGKGEVVLRFISGIGVVVVVTVGVVVVVVVVVVVEVVVEVVSEL